MPTTSVILGVLSRVPSLQEHGSEWVIQGDFFPKFLRVTIILCHFKGWSHQPYHPCKPSNKRKCEVENESQHVPAAGESMQPGWSARDWGFTHTLTMCICVEKPLLWHRGLLTQSSFFFFFKLTILTASLSWCRADSTVCVHSCCAIWTLSNLLN